MKKTLTFCFLFLFYTVIIAQAPQAFNYQGLARDVQNSPIANQNIGLRISILKGTTIGNQVYQEIHLVETNNLGLFSIPVGGGTPVLGEFSNIDWGIDSHFLRVEMDIAGGSNYILMGTSQLLSVPYALYAANSGDNTGGNSKWEDSETGISYKEGNVVLGDDRGEGLLQINPQNQIPQFGNFDVLLSTRIPDAPEDYFLIGNGTNLESQFIPFMVGHHESDNRYSLMIAASTRPENDVSNDVPLMDFSSRINLEDGLQSSPILNRPLFSWSNRREAKMLMSAEGYLGIGTTRPKAKLQIADGDIYIEDINKGVIMRSPNGQCWRMNIDNNGNTVNTAINCPN